jgi:hypothetical protein
VDFVLGVSMAPTTVRLVLIEGENADGVTVEQDNFEVAAAGDQAAPGAAVDQVIAAIVGTREGALAGGYQLNSTGVTWTDPAGVGALRDELAVRDVGSVMLVSPLLAAAALAQTVGSSIGYERTAMLFVEPKNATLAVVEVADGSIVELHRQPLEAGQGTSRRAVQGAIAAQLATMVAGLDARESRADGVFLIGCGTDIVSIKPALEAVTSLQVSAPEEPDMALARGAALASANAPLFASSTAALAYALDPGTGEMNPHAFSPTYLDVSAHADVLAYSALDDSADDEHAASRRRPSAMLAGSALAAIFAVVAGVLVFSLTADRPTPSLWHNPRASVATPAQVPARAPAQVPAQAPSPPPAQLPAPSAAPPAPPPEVAAPPPTTANAAPVRPAAPVRRAPAPRAPASVPTPVPQAAPSPVAPPPAAPPPSPPAVVAAPPPQPAPAAVPARPPMTMYLHFPFVTVPIPITPPPPPQPPPPPGP